MIPGAYILGCEGPRITPSEISFFAEANPWGFILFARNVEDPDQLKRLTSDLRNSIGRDAPILIDQEGGRVARMTAPHWRTWEPPLDFAESLGETSERAFYLRYRLIGAELRAVGPDHREHVRTRTNRVRQRDHPPLCEPRGTHERPRDRGSR